MNPDTREPYSDPKKAFATAGRLANIRNLRWHDLRHTFGTRLGEAGFSEATIAELKSRSDAKTTRRYTHGTDRAKRAAVEAVRVSRDRVCHLSRPDVTRSARFHNCTQDACAPRPFEQGFCELTHSRCR